MNHLTNFKRFPFSSTFIFTLTTLMLNKEQYYVSMLAHTKLALGKSQHGDGLFVRERVEDKEELLQEAPAFSYMVPLYHFTFYSSIEGMIPLCFHCFSRIEDANVILCCCAQQKLQSNNISHCKHIYCSERCQQRNWMQHCLTCIDNNIGQFATIKSFFSDKNTYSDLAVAEFITFVMIKVIMLYYNGLELEEAVNKSLEPFLNLYAPTNVQFQKVNIGLKIRLFMDFFKSSMNKFGFEIEDELKEFLINNFITHEYITYVYSLIAFNSVLIDGIGVGIYTIISKINHSCTPNSRIYFVNGEAILQVDHDIQPMEELFISYIDDTLPLNDRQSMLSEHWGFTCQCHRCLTKQ